MIMFLLQVLRTVRTTTRVLVHPEGRAVTTLFAVQLLTGTIFYHQVEHWGWVDSLYFSVTTLATVGLGDIAPVTDAGKLFTVMYILTGVGVLLALLDFVARHALQSEEDRTPG